MGPTTIVILLLAGVTIAASSFPPPSLSRAEQQVFPHIVEYINDFSLGSADLKRLADNQFRQITISDIITAAYEVHDSSIVLSYDGTSRQVEQVSPLKVKVTNDSFTLTANFQARVIHAVGGKNYSCTTKIPQVLISYTKAVDFDSGNTLISDFSSTYSSLSFTQPTCKETVAKSDSSALVDAVNSTKSGSLYSELKKIMDRIQGYMSSNAKDERLSRVYDQNPYSYDYYGFKMDVNVGTIEANPLPDNTIENAISGIITDSSFPAVAPPDYEQGYKFIKGAIEYAAKNYGAWREIKLNRNNMRTSMFRWRLIDFQYIVPSVLAWNPQSYLGDVDMQCELEEVHEVELDEKQLQVGIDWRCTAGFSGQDGRRVTFLSFLVGLKHSVDITLRETYLGVRVSRIDLSKLQFDYIGEYEVIDPFTVAEFIKESFFQFQTYTFGTFFKIQSKTLSKKLIPERGIWIG